MTDFKAYLSVFSFILLSLSTARGSAQVKGDTAVINRQNANAYIEARRNPDMSEISAHQALASSRAMNYRKGMADASLALGMAYLAKYNQGDSARYYNAQALSIYNETGDVTGKARACYGLTYAFSFKSDYQSSEKYARMALGFFEASGDHRGMINTLNALNYLAKQQQDLDAAKNYIERAIAIAREAKDTVPLADALNSLGIIYTNMSLFSQAIDTYFEALDLWEQKKDSNGISIAYGSIGLTYFYQKDYDRALEFFKKHLMLAEKSGDLFESSKMYNNIAQIYNLRQKSDSALIYLRHGLNLSRHMNLPSAEADACYNIASAMLYHRMTDSANWYIRKAIDITNEKKIPTPPQYFVTLADILRTCGSYSHAAETALLGYSAAIKNNKPLIISDAALLLSEIYGKTGRYDLAYKYLKEHRELQDSITSDEQHKQLTRMELQYNFDKKEKEAEYERIQERMTSDNKIRQQRTFLTGLGALFVLVALFSLLYLRHTRLKARYSQIDLEQRLLRAQMNPHFIFNSLCAIQDLIMADKPQKATAFLTKIARLMRNILENSREEYVVLDKEIETLRLYMDVQQLRFENGFEYEIRLDETIDPENISVPPMLAQPCVENSIEHGLLPGKENGRIKVSYSLKEGLMMLEVTDNGIGREKAAEIKPGMKKQSISTKLTEKRLQHFRQILKEKKISYEIIDLYEEGSSSGTKVVMMLPYRKVYA